MSRYIAPIIFICIAGLIWLPVILHPGQLFLLDNTYGSHIQLTDFIQPLQPHLPLTALQWAANQLLPIGLVQKLVYALLYVGLGMSAYLMARRYMSRFWAILAGLIYMLNPFMLQRTLAGHWLVLAGYAWLPIVLIIWQTYLRNRNRRNLIYFAMVWALFPIASLHVWYMSIPVFGLMWAIHRYHLHAANNSNPALSFKAAWWKSWLPSRLELIMATRAGVVIALSWLVVNAFWIVPALISSGNATLNAISSSDFKAFALVPDPRGGPWLTAVSLYGFWEHGYRLPKDSQLLWWAPGIVTACLATLGFLKWRKNAPVLSWGLAMAALVGVVISVGLASPLSAPLIGILSYFAPGFNGLRDTTKALGWLACLYALAAPYGGMSISRWLSRKFEFSQQLTNSAVCLLVLSIPIATLPGMLGGFAGQLIDRDYPASWAQAQQILNHQQANTVLALPWHGYLSFPFTRNHVIANPAQRYFDQPVIAAQTLDNQYLDHGLTDWDKNVQGWLDRQALSSDDYQHLAQAHISHLVIFKTVDWKAYQFLNTQSHLQRVYETPDISVYRIMSGASD